jgi:hypothetical protein
LPLRSAPADHSAQAFNSGQNNTTNTEKGNSRAAFRDNSSATSTS